MQMQLVKKMNDFVKLFFKRTMLLDGILVLQRGFSGEIELERLFQRDQQKVYK